MSHVTDLIAQGEHQTLDFKFRIDSQKKIARTLAAFANTDGGVLLIGVKDNGKIVGCLPEEEHHMIEGAAQMYCTPEVPFTSVVHQEKHRLVLEIIVSKSEKRIHKAPDDADKQKLYFRRKDQTAEVNKILRSVWVHEDKLTARPNVFDEEALYFLKLFSEESISLSKVYRICDRPKRFVDQLLPKFVFWGLVEMRFEDTGVKYGLPQSI